MSPTTETRPDDDVQQSAGGILAVIAIGSLPVALLLFFAFIKLDHQMVQVSVRHHIAWSISIMLTLTSLSTFLTTCFLWVSPDGEGTEQSRKALNYFVVCLGIISGSCIALLVAVLLATI